MKRRFGKAKLGCREAINLKESEFSRRVIECLSASGTKSGSGSSGS